MPPDRSFPVHLLAGGQENDGAPSQVRFYERPQRVQLLLRGHLHEGLLQAHRGGGSGLSVGFHVLWVLQTEAGQGSHALGLGGAEEQGLALKRQVGQDGVQGGGETLEGAN